MTPLDPSLIGTWLSFEKAGRVVLRVGKVELGQGITAALRRIAAEELDIDPARIDLTAGDTAATPDEGYTAGSLSIETSGMAVRDAASAARHLFLAALGDQGGRPIDIRDGTFVIDGSATSESFWTLASNVDLMQPGAGLGRPKCVESYRLVGCPGGGVDLREAVSGATYIHDLVMPDMLHGRMVRSPNPLARPRLPDATEISDIVLVRDSAFIGVIAAREDRAVRAAEWLERRVTWSDTGRPHPDPVQHIRTANEAGQLKTPSSAVDRVVDITVSRQFLAHASMGPSCAVALWESGLATVWTHSQGVFPLRDSLARLMGVDPATIRAIHVRGAGCYGHNGADDVAADALLLARAVPGKPVRVQWTRAQELANSPLGPAMRTRVVAGLDQTGRLASMRTSVISAPHARRPGVAGGINLLAGYLRTEVVEDPIVDAPLSVGGAADRNALPGYDIADAAHEKRIVHDPAVRSSALRALGAHVNVTAIEAVIDAAATLFGEDPIAYRLRHLSDPRARAVIERVAALAEWPRTQPAGIGYARYKNRAAYCAVIAEVALADDVRVSRVWCAVDAGLAIDPDGVVNQIEGGIIQSISWTLKEAVPFSGGVPSLENGWDGYPILRFNEVPDLVVELIERPNEPVLGVGEASQGPTAAAVANAVATALGLRVVDLPITRARIIDVLDLRGGA